MRFRLSVLSLSTVFLYTHEHLGFTVEQGLRVSLVLGLDIP